LLHRSMVSDEDDVMETEPDIVGSGLSVS
jgi:hypothetical protein